MGNREGKRINGLLKVTEPTVWTHSSTYPVQHEKILYSNPILLLSVSTVADTAVYCRLRTAGCEFGPFPHFMVPGDRTAILKTTILILTQLKTYFSLSD